METTPRSTVGSRELKIRLGTYLRRVRAGASLVVTDRGRPIAELRPLPARELGLDAKLESLAALGVISWDPDRTGLPKVSRPLPDRGRSLSRALADEREDRF
jgi:prevent-host-death family protein